MHDSTVEDRLRRILRQEGESLPFTLTADELERRHTDRRRARLGERRLLLAAGLAVVALGATFALSSGLLRGPAVGTEATPSPSAVPSISPSTSPSIAPSPTPEATTRVADPVGSEGEAVLVVPVGSDRQRPDAFEVWRFHPATEVSVRLSTIPGSVLPEDGWLEGGEDAPKVSATGWLVIPFTRGLNADVNHPALAIVDIRAPEGAAWILDGYRAMTWDETDKLVMEDGQVITIAWPGSRHLEPFAARDSSIDIDGRSVATQEGARFLATQDEPASWGFVGFDGVYTAASDLPPVYQRTGLERPTGIDAHTLGMACDSGQPGGCYLIENDPPHERLVQWHHLETDGNLFDFAWAADGASVWKLIDGGVVGGSPTASLVYSTDPASHVEVNGVQVVDGWSPRLLGISGEASAGQAAIVVIGDDRDLARFFVLADGRVVEHDGTAWFAGWAADPPAYDPD